MLLLSAPWQVIHISLDSAWDELMFLFRSVWGWIGVSFGDSGELYISDILITCLVFVSLTSVFTYIFNKYSGKNDDD